MTIEHSIVGLAGSITKLEFLPINLLTSLNNITVSNSIAFADINKTGAFEEIEIVPEAGFKTKTTDTLNGPLRSIEVTGAIMNDADLALFNLCYQRFVLLITDGNGKRWLFGNRAEYLKYEFDTDSKTSRGSNKQNSLMFKGVMTSGILLVL